MLAAPSAIDRARTRDRRPGGPATGFPVAVEQHGHGRTDRRRLPRPLRGAATVGRAVPGAGESLKAWGCRPVATIDVARTLGGMVDVLVLACWSSPEAPIRHATPRKPQPSGRTIQRGTAEPQWPAGRWADRLDLQADCQNGIYRFARGLLQTPMKTAVSCVVLRKVRFGVK